MSRSFRIHHSLSFRLIFWVGVILLITICTWAYFNIEYQRKKALQRVALEADKLGDTIKLGTHYAMMLNSRFEINQIINNIARQEDIRNIRIYNKGGEVKFSNASEEKNGTIGIKAEACHVCHQTEPPLDEVELMKRTRIFRSTSGDRVLGIISPIYNEKGCSAVSCHFHPENKKVLGLLDVVFSLEDMETEILAHEKAIILLALAVFFGASTFIALFILRFVNRPIKDLITGTRHIGEGDFDYELAIDPKDEIGLLAKAVNEMGRQIREKQTELNKQRDVYQGLFEGVPCYVTVQDRDLRLLRYNREFEKRFSPEIGDYCYKAYKNRTERCEICPVLSTFEDGRPHTSEETGVRSDGSKTHWMVRTTPIKGPTGEVIAALEMSLDITEIKGLQDRARKSEERYRTFFNTIPNPVFVLDAKDCRIIDCNDSVASVYGFSKEEILGTSFMDLFSGGDWDQCISDLTSTTNIVQARHTTKDGRNIYVNMRLSPSDYMGRKVFLVTSSDITKRLMAEQQLIQAGKMATLGEMATGVAHELNQPLTVMKTASSFLIKKISKGEPVKEEILKSLAEEIDSHVERAAKIINHMREFGRKSDVKKEKVRVNEPLVRALEIFNQQLRLREIEVVLELQEDSPCVMADSNRLEQVFINLLINARDAIEEKWAEGNRNGETKRIFLRTYTTDGSVIIEVEDSGTGIPEAILDKIFEPFYTTKEVGSGTGLGLSISYGIVQDYDGSIDAKTTPGRGSTFTVRFPEAHEG